MDVALSCAIQASANNDSVFKEYDSDCEVFRQRFRQFVYHPKVGPREAFNNLWELCCQWLQPEVRSKEEILEQLVWEQFLMVLPPEIQTWVKLDRPEKTERALALVEKLQTLLDTPEKQGGSQELVRAEHLETNMQGDSGEGPISGPSQEPCLTELRVLPVEPQNLDFLDVGDYSSPSLETDAETRPEHEGDLAEQKERGALCPFDFREEKREENDANARVLQTDSGPGNRCVGPPCVSAPPGGQRPPAGANPESPRRGQPVAGETSQKKSVGEKHLQCPHCDKRFARKSHLTGHQAVHSAAPHHCPECRKAFLRKSDFTRHLRVHAGEKPHQCSICQKRFSRKSHLVGHQNTHMPGETYTCSQCGKQLRHLSSLQRHMKAHTGEKPYVCDVCERPFNRMASLTLHQRTHTDERPFQCHYCEKSFRQKTTLTVHLRVHTGEMPYTCPFCPQRFRQRASLSVHKVSHVTGDIFHSF
ncbi:zinc finger protein 449-like [Tenrec ecaudatus]|uniref:zinc finger protein 449-like n=1 Tax=Tenrec ecaudatus TaxID=94439 RepID=UPI003F5A9A9F